MKAYDIAQRQANSVHDPIGVNAGPVPPRYWWLKRLLILSGGLIVALVCLRLWWGYEAHRRLMAEIDKYRAAGQPVFAREFDAELDAVPDEENAAILYEQAITSIVPTSQSGVGFVEFIDGLGDRSYETDAAVAQELYTANAGLFSLARQARDRPKVAWSSRLEGTFATGAFLRPLSGQRNFAKLLHFAASYEFKHGDHAAAVETIRDFIALSEAAESHPTLIHGLVGKACYVLALGLIEKHSGGLMVADDSGAIQESLRPASRNTTHGLINVILDEEKAKRAATRTYFGELALTIEDASTTGVIDLALPRGVAPVSAWSWLGLRNAVARPLLQSDILTLVHAWTAAASAAAESSRSSAVAHFPHEVEKTGFLFALRMQLPTVFFLDSWGFARNLNNRHFDFLARRRMAAIALAIRLFEVDHGHRPEMLSELVPEYLQTVPADPFANDGAAIRFSPHADNAILYSIGEDGIDNGGVRMTRKDGRFDRTRSDILFYLDGQPKATDDRPTPSPQANENDQDADDGDRQPKK